MEENLFNCSPAMWRIQNEYFDNLRTFKMLTGKSAKDFEKSASNPIPKINFNPQIESAKRILKKAKL